MNGLTTGWIRAQGSPTRACLCVALALFSGCVSDQQKHDAIVAVNQEFRAQYEATLAEKGTRAYALKHDDAFSAMSNALTDLGMRPESMDPSLGFMSFYSPAPTPLSDEDWRTTVEADLPKLRELVEPYIGKIASWFIKFEPEGLQIVVSATVIESPAGAALISLTVRMRQIEPPRSGMPRRDYLPPTGFRIGIDKVWNQFELETGRRKALPRQPSPR
jgi:hypothetical protein